MKLSELETGQSGIVLKVHGHGAFRKRVMEMGFVRGHTVTVLLHAPLRDPIKYSILGYEVSLRASEAALIDVMAVDPASAPAHTAPDNNLLINPDDGAAEMHRAYHSQSHTINVALIGNPNCGKTSLFNYASGAHEHVGNYSGVTVDAKKSHFDFGGYRINIVDLPGTYSLTSYSPEELYVRQYLRTDTPDVIINVVDASNLPRNLYLTTELIDMDTSMVVALNMYDDLRARGASLDYDTLGRMVGVPMVPVVAKTGEGFDTLFHTVIDVYEGRSDVVRHIHVNLGADLEGAIRQIVDLIKSTPGASKHFSPRYMAIKLLEGDHEMEEDWRRNVAPEAATAGILLRDKLRGRIENLHDEEISSIAASAKYGFVAGALAETYNPGKKTDSATRVLDSLATNKLLGFPLFFAIMAFIFWATFFVGQYPMDWLDTAVAWLSDTVHLLMPDGPLKDLIADGIIGGVGGVVVFLPNILILFFCISFMEDSGYMARAAFIMDKVMHRIGLHGKSFIPLIMGFGCNVPAILASRAIESRSSRIITVLINPFMSCSARLPLYVLLIGTFFPTHGWLVFTGLYLTGILAAVVTARMLRRFLFKKDETPFVMELPPYRMPPLKVSLRHTWEKGRQYLRKMGGIILVAAIIVWALNYFPQGHDGTAPLSADITATTQTSDNTIDPAHDSYLEMLGKAINPVMEPIGFHWRSTVAALAGIPAKEIVVSTLGVLYTGDEATDDARLSSRLHAINPATGSPYISTAAAFSLMLFILLYCPCVATVSAIARETGSWRYSAFSIVYNTALAWLVAFVAYHIMA